MKSGFLLWLIYRSFLPFLGNMKQNLFNFVNINGKGGE